MAAVHDLQDRIRRMMSIAENVLDDSLDHFVFRGVHYYKYTSNTSIRDNERTFSGRHPSDPGQTGYETYEARPQQSPQHRSYTNSYSNENSSRRRENIRYTCRKYSTGSERDIVDGNHEEEYRGHRVRRVSPDRPARVYDRFTRSHHWRETSFSRTTYYHYESTPLPQESPGPRYQSDYNEQYHQPQPSGFESENEPRRHRRGFKHTTYRRRPDGKEHRRDARSHQHHDDHSFSRGFSAAAEESARQPRFYRHHSDTPDYRRCTTLHGSERSRSSRIETKDTRDHHADRADYCPSDHGPSSSHRSHHRTTAGPNAQMKDLDRDHYRNLGVSSTATSTEIKKAYRALALRWHPDRNSSPEAEERFKDINEAHEILADETNRMKYDRGRA